MLVGLYPLTRQAGIYCLCKQHCFYHPIHILIRNHSMSRMILQYQNCFIRKLKIIMSQYIKSLCLLYLLWQHKLYTLLSLDIYKRKWTCFSCSLMPLFVTWEEKKILKLKTKKKLFLMKRTFLYISLNRKQLFFFQEGPTVLKWRKNNE